MFGGNPRRQAGIFQQPAGEDFAVRPFPGIGPFLPRIVGFEALAAQIVVIIRRLVYRRKGVQAVVAFEGLEAAFDQAAPGR